MTPQRWQRVKRILEDTLEQDAEARAAHLRARCGEDDDLRRDVESFLTNESEDKFLERAAVREPPPVPDSALDVDPHSETETKTGRVDEVRPVELAPYTKLVISTRSSQYELVVVAPLELEVLVKGGNRFPESTRAQLYRQETIRVGEELSLVIGTRKVVTTRIEAIELKD
jgi:hypothetical protein